jgi:GT2 family glycosyltransferase
MVKKEMNKTPDVSIVVVNWNTKELLRRCTESIFRETKEVVIEVIIVDNGSADGSAEAIQQEFPNVHIIRNNENKGFAAASNQGIEISRGRYVLLLNSDLEMVDRTIDKIVRFADANSCAGVVGCKIINFDDSVQPSCFTFPSFTNLLFRTFYLNKFFPRHHVFGRECMTWWSYDDTIEVEAVKGCFMFVRRSAIEQVGVLDEIFFLYFEESDWCYRMRQHGWKTIFTPSAKVMHVGGAAAERAGAVSLLHFVHSQQLFFNKYRGRIYYSLCGYMSGLFFGLRIVPWALFACLSRTRRKVAWAHVKIYVLCLYHSVRYTIPSELSTAPVEPQTYLELSREYWKSKI